MKNISVITSYIIKKVVNIFSSKQFLIANTGLPALKVNEVGQSRLKCWIKVKKSSNMDYLFEEGYWIFFHICYKLL